MIEKQSEKEKVEKTKFPEDYLKEDDTYRKRKKYYDAVKAFSGWMNGDRELQYFVIFKLM